MGAAPFTDEEQQHIERCAMAPLLLPDGFALAGIEVDNEDGSKEALNVISMQFENGHTFNFVIGPDAIDALIDRLPVLRAATTKKNEEFRRTLN